MEPRGATPGAQRVSGGSFGLTGSSAVQSRPSASVLAPGSPGHSVDGAASPPLWLHPEVEGEACRSPESRPVCPGPTFFLLSCAPHPLCPLPPIPSNLHRLAKALEPPRNTSSWQALRGVLILSASAALDVLVQARPTTSRSGNTS